MRAIAIIQAVLGIVTLAVVARRLREVLWRGAGLDTRLHAAAAARMRSGDRASLGRLAEGRAYLSRILAGFLQAEAEGTDVGIAVDEVVRDIRFELDQGARALRVLASFGSISALLGAGWQFLWLTSGDHGLATLVPGLPLKIATERAAIAVSGGFSIMLLAFAAQRILLSEAKRWREECSRMADALETTHDQMMEKSAPAALEMTEEAAEKADARLDPEGPD